jgi:hypothetical protein
MNEFPETFMQAIEQEFPIACKFTRNSSRITDPACLWFFHKSPFVASSTLLRSISTGRIDTWASMEYRPQATWRMANQTNKRRRLLYQTNKQTRIDQSVPLVSPQPITVSTVSDHGRSQSGNRIPLSSVSATDAIACICVRISPPSPGPTTCDT